MFQHNYPGNDLLRKTQRKDTKISSFRYKKSEAIKVLERMAMEAKKLKYPNNPYLVGDTYEDKTANGLTKAIVAYMRLTGSYAERVNTMGRPIDRTETFVDVMGHVRTIGSIDWIKGGSQKGSADIHSCVNGKTVMVEIKVGSDSQSPAQKAYQKSIESAGGLYFIAKDFESFKTWYDQISKV
jgi:hypothetical protein